MLDAKLWVSGTVQLMVPILVFNRWLQVELIVHFDSKRALIFWCVAKDKRDAFLGLFFCLPLSSNKSWTLWVVTSGTKLCACLHAVQGSSRNSWESGDRSLRFVAFWSCTNLEALISEDLIYLTFLSPGSIISWDLSICWCKSLWSQDC